MTATLNDLSRRQLQILGLAAAGMHNHEIAARLGIATSTVANTLKQIYAKIGVGNRVLAVRWLIEQVQGEE